MTTTPQQPQPGLTDTEHAALHLSGRLAQMVETIAGNDPHTRNNDVRKLQDHIHTVQSYILAQAAARAYPGMYRLLGGPVVNPDVLRTHHDVDQFEQGLADASAPAPGVPVTNPQPGDRVRLDPNKYGVLAQVDGTVILLDERHTHNVGILLGDYGTVFVPTADLTKTDQD